MRTDLAVLATLLLSTLLAGCSSAPAGSASLSPTATSAPSVTPTRTPLLQLIYACQTTTNGATKTISDPATGISFTYPAAWVEVSCQHMPSSDGGAASLQVGSLFLIEISQRNGESIQHWVARQAGGDTITLVPLDAPHAVAAVRMDETPTSGQMVDAPRFYNTIAVVAGTQYMYEVLAVNASSALYPTDTVPSISRAELDQIVSTFVVP